ncbi:zinc finger BED domain-containing protein RICESLEEPER 2-like [Canna indica]|uniref:Zinc finger BED domain-containing protein RICESLEEPER 2-like n=1 Tax=Canna indica TaxID=4628 RepID=A0AAQ3K1G9_9LILI|nr:zinc finger BED domain-containing protein RICESLEEPER 2-like [Canna indica]
MIEWEKVSRTTIKKDCVQVYETEKKKLKAQLKGVNKISLTTYLWRSTNQKIGRLVLGCKTRWNSTYEMLAIAIKFKEEFSRFRHRELNYDSCPSEEDWKKVEKIATVLEVFTKVTNFISGNDYPTSNLFLNEVYQVNVLLDKKS